MHPGQRIEILTLGVLPTFRKCRLATRLMHAVIDTLAGSTAPVVFAQVSTTNGPANNFYRHMGLLPGTNVIRDVCGNLPCGSRDAYIVSRRIAAAEGAPGVGSTVEVGRSESRTALIRVCHM
ncbi:hypothetical protein C8R44DRAFT_781907 [Mycena epipterygia]|nr:hypothetical protein C8R44DRAFT_781907 [Mycena epipterygia]